jgi:hypothetical protein
MKAKNFEEISRIIRFHGIDNQPFLNDLCDYFQKQNLNFNKLRFLTGKKEQPLKNELSGDIRK